jgi:hypothetical protein
MVLARTALFAVGVPLIAGWSGTAQMPGPQPPPSFTFKWATAGNATYPLITKNADGTIQASLAGWLNIQRPSPWWVEETQAVVAQNLPPDFVGPPYSVPKQGGSTTQPAGSAWQFYLVGGIDPISQTQYGPLKGWFEVKCRGTGQPLTGWLLVPGSEFQLK